jgi:hypothetical protein
MGQSIFLPKKLKRSGGSGPEAEKTEEAANNLQEICIYPLLQRLI